MSGLSLLLLVGEEGLFKEVTLELRLERQEGLFTRSSSERWEIQGVREQDKPKGLVWLEGHEFRSGAGGYCDGSQGHSIVWGICWKFGFCSECDGKPLECVKWMVHKHFCSWIVIAFANRSVAQNFGSVCKLYIGWWPWPWPSFPHKHERRHLPQNLGANEVCEPKHHCVCYICICVCLCFLGFFVCCFSK